jgi:predicted SprT family Zn-dependent metalloprotease
MNTSCIDLAAGNADRKERQRKEGRKEGKMERRLKITGDRWKLSSELEMAPLIIS